MFDRPRCRNWSPLATQQLRLRNLIGIKGQSIVCSIKSQLYFTLHLTAMSAPFYTSEKIDSHGSGNIDWPEINCPMILKSTSKSVCIRVWEHIPLSTTSSSSLSLSSSQDLKDSNDSVMTPENIGDYNVSFDKEQKFTFSGNNTDKMLFIWGVYFSGLILITKRSEAKFLSNSLIFQMHGGYFASADTLTQDSMRQQLKLTYQSDQETFGSIFESSPTNYSSKNQKRGFTTRNYEQSLRTAAESCDIFNNINTNISNLGTRKNTKKQSAKEKEFQINSPRSSRSCSPARNQNYNSCSPSMDISRDVLGMLKIRYLDKIFFISEIRPSYSLDKLLHLQETQRKFKRRSEDAKEIIEKICTKSAFCLNLELISNKGLLYRHRSSQHHSSMGKTLNRLLYQEPQIKPEDLLKAQELRRQIETARFRCRSLQQQRNRAKINLKQLEKKLCDLHDINIEQESFLMASLRNLSREKEYLIIEKNHIKEKEEDLIKFQQLLNKSRKTLCSELKEIYPIEKRSKGKYTIGNVYLPNSDKLSDLKFLSAKEKWECVSPLSLSVAYGYVAHLTQVCSIILNLPLRNPIKHEGSRSKILEIIKEIPSNSREFPLFNRSNVPSKQFTYGIFLLNQNITQLNFQVHDIKCNLKKTLPNLLQLLDKNDNVIVYDESSLSENQEIQLEQHHNNQFKVEVLLSQDNSSKTISHDYSSSSLSDYNQKQTSGSSVDLNNVPLPPTVLIFNSTSDPIDVINGRSNNNLK